MHAIGEHVVRNRILNSLSPADFQRIQPSLELVETGLKDLLYDVDTPITHVYFVEHGVISVVGVSGDGHAIEVATIGFEGFIGLPIFHGTDRTSSQAFCQIPGSALKMTTDAFRAALVSVPQLTLMLHRYTMALFTLVSQSSACNRLHTMQERCARWLLHSRDRVLTDEIQLTHQFLSQMLGVRRATVSEALGTLQAGGALESGQGIVTIRDRGRLEAMACECYAIIQREFDRLLGTAVLGENDRPLHGLRTSENGLSTLEDGTPRKPVHESN